MSGTVNPANADDQYRTLAFYIVVDVSYSMLESGAIHTANQLLPEVIQAVTKDSSTADVVRLGMIDFSDTAQVVLRLGDLRDINSIPQLTERGATSYAAAFRMLRQEIERDVAQLKVDNFRVYRPVVFFITDGMPTDDAATLSAAFAELTDASFKFRPNIIPFGVGNATKAEVDPWIFPKTGEKQMRSYVTVEGADPAKAITEIGHMLVSSIVSSAGSVSAAGSAGAFVLPDDEDLDDDVWL
jgi:uncharacterized protein YegL